MYRFTEATAAITAHTPLFALSRIRSNARLNPTQLALVRWLGLALLTGAAWVWLQTATPNIVGYDGYYHIKLADLMRRAGIGGLRLEFIWLPLTILAPDRYADHHFLFHLLLAPFTFLELTLAAKLAALLFATLTFLTIGWSLKRQQVFGAFGWTLALFVLSDPFLLRMAMPRAQSLSLLFLILAVQWMIEGKTYRLLPLAIGYVWLYNAFLLLPLLAALYVVAVWIIERRLVWPVFAWVVAGTLIGFAFHPYTPNNIWFTLYHLYPKFIQPTTASVGSEWSPYSTWTLFQNSGPALGLFVLGTMGLGLRGKRMTSAELTWLFCTLVFGILLFKSRRFIEYYPAFALMFCAVVWSEPLRQAWHRARPQAQVLGVGMWALLFLVAAPFTFLSAHKTIATTSPLPTFEGASAWLQRNTPPRARVFQTDWDDFPRLFFYNTHNTYTHGLDPTYSELYDRELYDLWVKITRGEIKNPSTLIRERFGARYVISDLDHKDFINVARRDPHMTVAYSDNLAIVFAIQ